MAQPITIRFNGEKEVLAFFDRYDIEAANQIDAAIEESARAIEVGARARAPTRTLTLAGSIAAQKMGYGFGWNVAVRKRYGAMIEFGSGPYGAARNRQKLPVWYRHRTSVGFPKIKASKRGRQPKGGKMGLTHWALSKGLKPFLVARAIFRRQGTAPHPFLYPAFELERPALIERIRSILARTAVEEAKQ